MPAVSKERFSELLQQRLGDHFQRAQTIFDNYGGHLSFDVTNVLLHASDQGKVEEILTMLEEHWQSHLQFQHPEVRGTVYSSLGINETRIMLESICKNWLKLQPSQ